MCCCFYIRICPYCSTTTKYIINVHIFKTVEYIANIRPVTAVTINISSVHISVTIILSSVSCSVSCIVMCGGVHHTVHINHIMCCTVQRTPWCTSYITAAAAAPRQRTVRWRGLGENIDLHLLLLCICVSYYVVSIHTFASACNAQIAEHSPQPKYGKLL